MVMSSRFHETPLATFVVTTALAVVTTNARADGPKRHKVDEQEMTNERVLRPHVAELIEQGEAALRGNELARAADLFHRASLESPHGSLAYRRECQTLTSLGRRAEAIRVCNRATANQGSAMDLRALVGAIVSAPPTPTELANAFGFAKRARDVMTLEPFGYAAQCDIARRLGDPDMLNQCLEELRRVAPDHYETRRVEAIAAAIRHPWRYAFGWAAVGAVFIGTLVHAVWRSLRRIRPSSSAIAPLVGALVFLCAPTLRAADAPNDQPRPGSLSQWQVNDADPVASVPTHEQRDANPLEYGYFIMDLSDRADQAAKRGDHAAAVKYWLALAKAVPDRSVGFTRACDEYEALGEWDKAVGACKAALYKEGIVVKDYARFVALVLQKKAPLEVAEVQDLDKILDHLRKMESGRAVVDELNCDIGVRLGSVERLESCTAALASTAPDHPRTVYFQWTLALLQKRYADARLLVLRAKATGTSAERVQQMEKATTAASSVWFRMKRRWPIALGGILMALTGVVFWVRASRKRPLARAVHT